MNKIVKIIVKIYTWIAVAYMLVVATYCIIGMFDVAFVWFLGGCMWAFWAVVMKMTVE